MRQPFRVQEGNDLSLALSRLRPGVTGEEAEPLINFESAVDSPKSAPSVFLKPLPEPQLSGQQPRSPLNNDNLFSVLHLPMLPALR